MIRAALRYVGRLLLDLGQPPAPTTLTNRAQLLRAPKPYDDCDAYQPGEPAPVGQPGGTCQSDGHYLCMECTELDPEAAYYREHGDYWDGGAETVSGPAPLIFATDPPTPPEGT